MGGSGRERCKIGKVRVDVNGVESSKDFRVRFVGQRGVKGSANIGGIQRVAVHQTRSLRPEAISWMGAKPREGQCWSWREGGTNLNMTGLPTSVHKQRAIPTELEPEGSRTRSLGRETT